MAFGREDGGGAGARILSSFVFVLGFAWTAWIVAGAIVQARVVERDVTLTRAAERDVKADLAVWPMTVSAVADDVVTLQSQIDASVGAARGFLVASGFDEAEIVLEPQFLVDRALMDAGAAPAGARYVVHQPLTVRSSNVDLVAALSRRTGELSRLGVGVAAAPPAYLYSGADLLADELRAEAGAAARVAAEGFADAFDMRLMGVRAARFDELTLAPSDAPGDAAEEDAIFKTARVAATITFLLDD